MGILRQWKTDLQHSFVGPWGNISADLAGRCRFGFFGEFGYGVISWLPYLKYLSEKGIPINAIAPSWQKPLWSFASSFESVDVSIADKFGGVSELRKAQKQYKRKIKIIAPTNKKLKGLVIGGEEWLNPFLNRSFTSNNYSPLTPKRISFHNTRQYVVINYKNYFNWSNEDIDNFYRNNEIIHIAKWARHRGFDVILNRFPSPFESTNIYTEESQSLHCLCEEFGISDAAEYYVSEKSESYRNMKQFGLIAGAQHVFATQGGNAAIALILNRDVSIIMRGGMDYPDYMSLAAIYGGNIDIAYEAHQFKVLKL